MTTQQQLDIANAIIADANGKSWQVGIDRGVDGIEWVPPIDGIGAYLRQLGDYLLRPKPEPSIRLWHKPEHVPTGCWIKSQVDLEHPQAEQMVIGVSADGIFFIDRKCKPTLLQWERISEHTRWSYDRKEWHECVPMTPAKVYTA